VFIDKGGCHYEMPILNALDVVVNNIASNSVYLLDSILI